MCIEVLISFSRLGTILARSAYFKNSNYLIKIIFEKILHKGKRGKNTKNAKNNGELSWK
jgi:hypothetical protein